MGKIVVLTGVGRDRVGIVAELAEVLYDLGCNLLDSSMTLLRGEFALILMAKVPDHGSVADVRKKIGEVEARLGMTIHVRELMETELVDSEEAGITHMISVYGADKPGIVAGVTRVLAGIGVNITDVETKYSGKDVHKPSASTVFLMVLEVSVPLSLTTENVEKALHEACSDLGVHISIQVLDAVEL